MLSGKNSKIMKEMKAIFVPIKAQFSDYHKKVVAWMHTEE